MTPYDIEVEVLAASTQPYLSIEDRMLTFRLRYPRFIHAEVMTHKMPRRNGASSRANSLSKMLGSIWTNMASPIGWGADQKGMFASEELTGLRLLWVKFCWYATGYMVLCMSWLMGLAGPHKQYVNRMAEPWAFINVQYTLTYGELLRIAKLRTAHDAQPEIQVLFQKMVTAARHTSYDVLEYGDWHLPWITDAEHEAYTLDECINVSVSRSARISYTPEGIVLSEFAADTRLAKRLWRQEHYSPAEHQFTPREGIHAGVSNWINARTLAELGQLKPLT